VLAAPGTHPVLPVLVPGGGGGGGGSVPETGARGGGTRG
jgi:hypothetical protein